MEGLSEVAGTLKVWIENYRGEAREEFCTFVVGLRHLSDALKAYENQAERKESGKEDVMAIGRRVEHDLYRFIRWPCDRLFGATDFLKVCNRPRLPRWSVVGHAVSAARSSRARDRASTGWRPNRVQWRGGDRVSVFLPSCQL